MIRTKRDRKHIVLLILLLAIGIGFAALTAVLKIDGLVNIDAASWDIHFENVQITTGSVTATTVPTTDNTTTTEMTYAVGFTTPGDFYEFTVDIANDGSIDAMVDLVTNKAYASDGTTEIALPSYLTNTVTYDDGVEIKQNQLLAHNTSEKIKVRVEFKKDISAADLPSGGDTTIVFKFKGDYKQANDDAKYYKVYNPGDLVYFDPVTQENCDEESYNLNAINNGTSTCYKWRVITTNDNRFNDKINIQLDHNLVNKSQWASSDDTGYIPSTPYGQPSINTKGPITALKALATATSSWTISNLNYTYDTTGTNNNYGILTCNDGTCTNGDGETIVTGLKVRMITGEEVTEITKTKAPSTSWTLSSTSNNYYYFSSLSHEIGTKNSGTGNTDLSWLIENINEREDSGSTTNQYDTTNDGYWTMTPVSSTSYCAWFISDYGQLMAHFEAPVTYSNFGARPVIEIVKTKLNQKDNS